MDGVEIVLIFVMILMCALADSSVCLVTSLAAVGLTAWRSRKSCKTPPEKYLDKKIDNQDEVAKLFAPTVADADEQLATKNLQNGRRNQDAILARVKFNSNAAHKYFEEELGEQDNRHWWEDESLDQEMDRRYAP